MIKYSPDDIKKSSQQVLDEITDEVLSVISSECLKIKNKFRQTGKREEIRPRSPINELKIERYANEALVKRSFEGTAFGIEIDSLR